MLRLLLNEMVAPSLRESFNQRRKLLRRYFTCPNLGTALNQFINKLFYFCLPCIGKALVRTGFYKTTFLQNFLRAQIIKGHSPKKRSGLFNN